jgi:hypothetical protein
MLPAMSIAIAISSWALGTYKPIHLTGNNIILIAGVFTIISGWLS